MKEAIKQFFISLNYRWKKRDHINAVLLGKLLSENVIRKGIVPTLDHAEFRVFSQCGEDGIIQYLINNIEIPNKIFIEFGVENYLESNTRFLLLNNNWKGLVIDGSRSAVDFIKKDPLAYYRSDLTAFQNFITKDNINQLLKKFTEVEDIGLLSIDVDGNDYWIFDAITAVKPRIIICEYNAFYGPDVEVTIPYNESFIREKYHKSFTYFGASLAGLVKLADKKGYDFVGCETHGANAFFVRKDLAHPFLVLSAKDGYKYPLHKEFRGKNKKILHMTIDEIQRELADTVFFDLNTQQLVKGEFVFKINRG